MPNAPTSPVPSSPSFQRASRTTQRSSSSDHPTSGTGGTGTGGSPFDETSTHDGGSVKSDANMTTELWSGGHKTEEDDDDGDEIDDGYDVQGSHTDKPGVKKLAS